ncbi:hypothetical protein TWF506_007721 [Arthrobotrys conoides]|uniref:Uncharacterized protein n=1 Tax=Arthrobotrys conoides TaxID=74498 RepID=A0AAN8RZU5_9PEZI
MAEWIDGITFDAFSAYLLVLTENKNNKPNSWTPPNVLVVPVHPNDADPSNFSLDAMGQIEHYKRRCLVGILNRLNERDNGKCIWTAYRLTLCEDKGLLFTVKATASTTIRQIHPPTARANMSGQQPSHSVVNATKPVNAFAKPQGNQPFANGNGNQQHTFGTNNGFGGNNPGFGGGNIPPFGSGNVGFGDANPGFISGNQGFGGSNTQGSGNGGFGNGGTAGGEYENPFSRFMNTSGLEGSMFAQRPGGNGGI